MDDDQAVLKVVVAILEGAGFRILSADCGSAAISLSKVTAGKIDLLLSDVDMPEMSGPDLGETLKASRRDLRVMLMSGGTDGNLLVLNYGWAYIQKPFVAVKLVQMITEVLYSQDRSQPGGQEFDSRKDHRERSPASCESKLNGRPATASPAVNQEALPTNAMYSCAVTGRG